MKFNTKLAITSITIILLPIVLALTAYWVIGIALSFNIHDNYGLEKVPISVALNPSEIYSQVADDYYNIIANMIDSNDRSIEETDTLRQFDDELNQVSSSLVVRKGDELFFANDNMARDPVIPELLKCGKEEAGNGKEYYFGNISRLVKQKNFVFQDGSQGSIFLVTNIKLMISETNLSGFFISIICIMILTSILLTAWLRQSIFKPFAELKKAMTNISSGNFEEPAITEEKGEIGELFKDFEAMRLKLKSTADEKKESERMNQELVRNISHDLKTPITSIKGYVEGIMDGVADSPEKTERYIRTIYNKANDMDHLIDELTIYSRIDTNRVPYQFHKINVGEYFGDCAEEVGLDLDSKGLDFEFVDEVSLDDTILADPEQLKRVINNIINNSIKYSDKKNGKISLKILDAKEFIEVQIADNGRGIPADELPKIFDRFYRTDASRNSSQGGSGIGLSIARKLVEDHGGEIWASGEEGKGLCIHFTLRKFLVAVPEEEVVNEENPIQKLEKLIRNSAIGIRTETEKAVAEIKKAARYKDREKDKEAEKDAGINPESGGEKNSVLIKEKNTGKERDKNKKRQKEKSTE